MSPNLRETEIPSTLPENWQLVRKCLKSSEYSGEGEVNEEEEKTTHDVLNVL